MKKIVVLTGAGISAESGIRTFRDSDGLWEEHCIEDVATFEAWQRNPDLVLDFYNQRRKQLYEVGPTPPTWPWLNLKKNSMFRSLHKMWTTSMSRPARPMCFTFMAN